MKVVSALLAMTLSVVTAANDPGKSALDFLEKVRSGNIDLEPGGDTALSPHTSSEKRREIARRLKRLADDLGKSQLELGPVKRDDGFAAALIRKTGGFDPNRLQVFPVALVQRKAEWVAAPVPASFENAGVGYTTQVRDRLKALEDWMLHERASDLEQLRVQSAERVRKTIEASLSAAALRKSSARQTVNDFLRACDQRNLTKILGFIGGLDTPLPNDWPLRLRAAEDAIAAGQGVSHPWRFLIAPEVIRLPVYHEEDTRTATVSIACLDPALVRKSRHQPDIQLLHLELSKNRSGFWRVDLPSGLLHSSGNESFAADPKLDADFLDAFPRRLADQFPRNPKASIEEAAEALAASLAGPTPTTILSLFRIQDEPKTARRACGEAARLWWSCQNSSDLRRAHLLSVSENGSKAACSFQFVSARSLDHLNLQVHYFEKTTDGWLWLPRPDEQTKTQFRQWAEEQHQHWKTEWPRTLLGNCVQLETVGEDSAPTEDAAREAFAAWSQSIHSGNALAALQRTARFNGPKSDSILIQNLGYEMTGAQRQTQPTIITHIFQGRLVTAIGAKTTQEDTTAFPLFPVIMTPDGPRILLEIDLFATSTRSREFLNRIALDRLRDFSPAVADEVKTLLEQYKEATASSSAP